MVAEMCDNLTKENTSLPLPSEDKIMSSKYLLFEECGRRRFEPVMQSSSLLEDVVLAVSKGKPYVRDISYSRICVYLCIAIIGISVLFEINTPKNIKSLQSNRRLQIQEYLRKDEKDKDDFFYGLSDDFDEYRQLQTLYDNYYSTFTGSTLASTSPNLATLTFAEAVRLKEGAGFFSPSGPPEELARLIVNQEKTLNSGKSDQSSPTIGLRRHPRQKVLAHKHIMAQHVIEDCDWINDGFVNCAKPESLGILRAMAERRKLVFILFAVTVLILLMLTQCIIQLSTKGVAKSRDIHLKKYEEGVFKQIATVLLVLAVMELLMQSRLLGVPLEDYFFAHFIPLFPWIEHVSHVDFVVDYLLIITLTFAACFLLLAIHLAACGWWICKWLRKADAMNVHNVSLKIEGTSNQVTYLVLRYEFEDAVQQSGVPGLDPPGLYFENYCRACAYNVAAQLLSIPSGTLIIALICTCCIYFLPLASVKGKAEIISMCVFAGIPLCVLIVVEVMAKYRKRKLLPPNSQKYLNIRLAWDSGSSADGVLQHGSDGESPITPLYQAHKASKGTCLPNFMADCLYGTRFPNNHEALFWLWRKGPDVMIRICQVCIFGQLVALAFSLSLMDAHSTVWFTTYSPWGPLCLIGLCVIQWSLLPFLLWNLVVITKTSGLVSDTVLQEVWETQRTRTVQRFRVLIDMLRCESNLLRLERGGRQLRDYWNDRAQFDDDINVRNDDMTFRKLDPDNQGLLHRNQIYRYLVSEGLPIDSEVNAARWVNAFDRRNKHGLDLEDFKILAWNIRNLFSTSLDLEAVAVLFSEKYELPPESILDSGSCEKLFAKWGLKWTKSHIIHLFSYMTGKRNSEALTVKEFVSSLYSLETNTIGTLRQAVGDMTNVSEVDDSLVSGSRSSVESLLAIPHHPATHRSGKSSVTPRSNVADGSISARKSRSPKSSGRA